MRRRTASPRYIHGDDRYRLKDPLSLLDPALVAMLEQQFGTAATWREPDDVVELADQDTRSSSPGSPCGSLHAPGHTEGSVMFALPTVPDGVADRGLGSTLLTGDVLFAGSIGRTDLPGGDGGGDDPHACATWSCRCRTTPSSCPATAPPPRSGASAPRTPTCSTSDWSA